VNLRRRTSDLWWLLGGCAALAATAIIASRPSVPGWEWDIFNAINGLPGFLWPSVWLPMQFGTYVVTPVLAAIALTLHRGRMAAELMIAGTLGYFSAKLFKELIGRPRPGALMDAMHLRGVGTTGGGFPSGHAAASAALAFVLFAWLPRRWGWGAVALAAAVAFLRVYTGAHLPLDVIGGAGLGIAAAAATTWVLKVPVEDD